MDESLNIHPSSTHWQGSRCVDRGVFCAQCWCGRWNQGASWRVVVEMFGFDRWAMLISGEKAYFPSATWGSFLEFAYKWSSESGMRWPSKAMDPDISGWTLEVQFHMEGSGMMCSWRIFFLTQQIRKVLDNKQYVISMLIIISSKELLGIIFGSAQGFSSVPGILVIWVRVKGPR